MFRQCAKDHNKGVLVSFTRVAGTRMCGHLIAALRLLRLKPALLACVRTPEFLRAKKHRMVVVALTKEVVWDFIYSCCQAFYPIMRLVRLADSKIPNMHLLKYYVLQSDRMLEKYLPKVELSYASIPHHIRAIMGDTSAYQIEFDPPPPPKKTPRMRLESKSMGTNDDITSDLSSNEEEEEENYDEEVESDTESDINDVSDPGDNIEVVDSVGHTLTGRIMLAWKASRADLLHDFACVAFLFSPNPTVQEYVVKNHVQADNDAAERLIAKWLIPESTLGTEQSQLMASLVTTLWKEWGKFLPIFILLISVLN